MATAQNQEWFVHLNGEQRGPLTAAIIREGLGNGTFSPADWVWRDGLAGWCQIQETDDFDEPAAKSPRNRWKIWIAAVLGLGVSAVTVALNYQKFLTEWNELPAMTFVPGFIGYAAAAPLLFMLIVVIRNLIVCRRP